MNDTYGELLDTIVDKVAHLITQEELMLFMYRYDIAWFGDDTPELVAQCNANPEHVEELCWDYVQTVLGDTEYLELD